MRFQSQRSSSSRAQLYITRMGDRRSDRMLTDCTVVGARIAINRMNGHIEWILSEGQVLYSIYTSGRSGRSKPPTTDRLWHSRLARWLSSPLLHAAYVAVAPTSINACRCSSDLSVPYKSQQTEFWKTSPI